MQRLRSVARPLLVAFVGLVGLGALASPAAAQALPFDPAVPTLSTPTLAGPAGPSGPTVATPPDLGSPRGPFIQIDMGDGKTGGLPTVLKIVLLFAALAFVPALLLAMTSFTRIIIVLSMVRQGIGMAQLPPNRVLVALALFLTAFTMAPTFGEVRDKAITPWQAGELDELGALQAAAVPLKTFMLAHTREQDLMLFIELAGETRPHNADDVSIISLVPAFILSELKTAFQMGALLFLPFLVIELVVGSILMSMGMMMLPPATVSLPLKILVFVAVDGWGLVVGTLARSIA